MEENAPRWTNRLPWIDACAALTAGVLMLLLRGVLSDFYGLSVRFITVIALVNMAYSIPGFTLGRLRPRPRWLLHVLIAANLSWTCICVLLALRAPDTITFWGYGHILGEGAFVATLALFEWRHRRAILAR